MVEENEHVGKQTGYLNGQDDPIMFIIYKYANMQKRIIHFCSQ